MWYNSTQLDRWRFTKMHVVFNVPEHQGKGIQNRIIDTHMDEFPRQNEVIRLDNEIFIVSNLGWDFESFGEDLTNCTVVIGLERL